jgi:hypothetical protein
MAGYKPRMRLANAPQNRSSVDTVSLPDFVGSRTIGEPPPLSSARVPSVQRADSPPDPLARAAKTFQMETKQATAEKHRRALRPVVDRSVGLIASMLLLLWELRGRFANGNNTSRDVTNWRLRNVRMCFQSRRRSITNDVCYNPFDLQTLKAGWRELTAWLPPMALLHFSSSHYHSQS